MTDLEPLTIEFDCTVEKVQSMADNAIRVYLDLPEDCIPQMALLQDMRRRGVVLHIKAEELDEDYG